MSAPVRTSVQSRLTGKVQSPKPGTAHGPSTPAVGGGTTTTRSTATTSSCICNRPRQLIMCQQCGAIFEGRVKRTCPSHPSITFLLDLVACIGCKMDNVAGLKEFPKMNEKSVVPNRNSEAMDMDN